MDSAFQKIEAGLLDAIAAAESVSQGTLRAEKDSAMIGDSGYERIEADFYPTPPENVDCLLQHVAFHDRIWEPAAGKLDISQRLIEFGHGVVSSDLHAHVVDLDFTGDFLAAVRMPNGTRAIVTNPPYETIDLKEDRWEHLRPLAAKYKMTGKVSLAELFVRHALAVTQPVRGQVAMFLRNEFDCGKGRMDLFGLPPFAKKIVVTKRPRWIADSTGSPRHNYAWFVWDWRLKSGSASISYAHPDYTPAPSISSVTTDSQDNGQ